MLENLLAASHLMPLELLPVRVNEHAASAGMSEVLIHVADLRRSRLLPLTGGGEGTARPAEGGEAGPAIEGTLPGRAYRDSRILADGSARAGEYRWWVPLLDGTERLGVLRVTTVTDDARTLRDMTALASLISLILVSKSGHSDFHARLTRLEPMNIATEMQWRLMPPRAYADGRVVIAAAMEPAYRVSGDAYDYATAGSTVHLSIFDAMGHDTAAGLTANLAVSACRSARHREAGLVEITERIEEALIEQYGHTRYATGILAHLDTRTGVFTWVNRGHHLPVLIRRGRWAGRLRCRPAHPMGTGLGLRITPCREQLEPGDRVVLYTDGITEARGRDGSEFGLERFIDFLIRHHADGLPVPETLRRLVQALLEYHDGPLRDDATVLFCEWVGSDPGTTATAAALTGLTPP
ncbi:PP2C family protein-serine/threonine phosphatase [Streptomyces sp. ST2-7A]|uniref:PP2C family protein-serine/threonine phosphatase n=1 Tax=Streptomyces sp. ST2-7A TaxID=2907214 RepID=UPI001F41ABBC|nr:PP2C family protein-serine/threonine phosphatase [Streptomyces sp. ST2-7A]MCE7080516.1 serine/threonine-protein phosphatase [Streptomyces sp. ST2-7A]